MNTAPRQRPRPPSLAADLESLLLAYLGVQERLLEIAGQQRAALAAADAEAIGRCASRHQEAADELRRLELQRRRVAGQGPPGRAAARLSDLALRFDEPDRSRVRALGERVRVVADRVAQEHRLLRTATASLCGHVDGLVRQVARALSPSGTYTRRGAVAGGATLARGIDLRR